MDPASLLEERLRELCCIGDERNVKLLVDRGVSINAANHMNGWTPLHWAAKRGHKTVVEYLIKQGVDSAALTAKGETAAQLSTDANIKEMLGKGDDATATHENLPIVPNYLRNPTFFYADKEDSYGHRRANQMFSKVENPDTTRVFVNGPHVGPICNSRSCSVQTEEELVLRLRIANSEEKDFIEVDLDQSKLTFKTLLTVCSKELCIDSGRIKKLRKLPNTIVRNDKDAKRLRSFQEVEVVLLENASSSLIE